MRAMSSALPQELRLTIEVISTGESLRAMEELVNEAGGIIVGKMAVLAEGDANDRPDITVLGKLPLFNPDGTPKA